MEFEYGPFLLTFSGDIDFLDSLDMTTPSSGPGDLIRVRFDIERVESCGLEREYVWYFEWHRGKNGEVVLRMPYCELHIQSSGPKEYVFRMFLERSKNPDVLFWRLLTTTAPYLYTLGDGFLVHGCAIARRESSERTLLTGESGVGKTSLSAIARFLGFYVVDDEKVFVYKKNEVWYCTNGFRFKTIRIVPPVQVTRAGWLERGHPAQWVTTSIQQTFMKVFSQVIIPDFDQKIVQRFFDKVLDFLHNVQCGRLQFNLEPDLRDFLEEFF